MEVVNKLMYMALAVMLFCIGLFLLIYGATTYMKSLSTVREGYQDEVIYQQANDLEGDIVPFYELIATLLGGSLDYDIEINGMLIRKEDYEVGFINQYNIRNTDYRKSYVYDTNGDISLIVYESMNEERITLS